MLQNLLDYDPGLRCGAPQPLQVLERIAQAVDVIDAYAIQYAFSQPAQDKAVRVVKDLLIFHPQANQTVDVEETSVTEVTACGAPERQPVVLPFEHLMQKINVGVEPADFLVDSQCHVR